MAVAPPHRVGFHELRRATRQSTPRALDPASRIARAEMSTMAMLGLGATRAGAFAPEPIPRRRASPYRRAQISRAVAPRAAVALAAPGPSPLRAPARVGVHRRRVVSARTAADTLAMPPADARDEDRLADDPPPDASVDEEEVTSTAHIFAQLVKFTLPTMAIWMCGPILSMVDTAVVGVKSTLELAAMSPGAVFIDYPCYIVCACFAVPTTTLVAEAQLRASRGEAPDDGSGVARVVSDSVAIAAVVGALVAAALYAAAPATISAFAGPASAAVVPYALSYALIRCLAIPAAVITSSAQAAFLACKSPWQPLTSVGLAGVVNLIFDVVLVVGLGAGIRGAAVATAGSQICMASVLLIALLREGRRRRAAAAEKAARAAELAEEAGGGAREGAPGVDEEAINLPFLNALPRRFPSVATTVRFISIAAPVGFLTAIKVFFVGSLMQAVTAISPECSAANGVMSAIYFFWGVMGDGVSQAAQTFLPPVLGTKNASKTAATLLAGAMGLGLISAVLASVLAVAFPGVFTNSAVVAELMRGAAPYMAAALFLNCASMGSEGCLLAARDVKFMTLCYLPNAAAAYWTLRMCLSPGGVFGWGSLGAGAAWVALGQFHLFRLLANAGRLYFGSPGKPSPLRRKLVFEDDVRV